ncbi:MAG TPA: sigma-70 family RNA polymerase sigma factor [Thermoanaerobaculia bacterium]|jgi:RNA polymerase sigma-70 factor (ECF subfamily)|nr:sigma-70 family RNA polymerase sigma factor [Thermoanaerobaculia bacterium]
MDPTSSQTGPPAALSDAALIRQVTERQPDALAKLYDRFAPTLLALARRILDNHADAEEVLQEVFVQVWNRGERYDPARSSVSTWLVLIARSRAIDRLRSRKVVERTHEAGAQAMPAAGEAYASPEAVENVFIQERHDRVQREMAALPAEQRQVLEMAFYEGLTQSEIAAKAGLPLGTVKTRTLLAMKKLRQALREEIRQLL